MTQPPSPDPQPFDLSYQSVPEHRNAPLLVKLAVIFTFISAGLDLVGGFVWIGMAIFMYHMLSRFSTLSAATGTGPSSMPAMPPMTLILVEYSVFSGLSFAVGIVKLIGGFKLRARGPNAWGWGLASGIIGCVELWCSLACVLPMSAGIYTIVILCQPHVRKYLRARPPQNPSPAGL